MFVAGVRAVTRWAAAGTVPAQSERLPSAQRWSVLGPAAPFRHRTATPETSVRPQQPAAVLKLTCCSNAFFFCASGNCCGGVERWNSTHREALEAHLNQSSVDLLGLDRLAVPRHVLKHHLAPAVRQHPLHNNGAVQRNRAITAASMCRLQRSPLVRPCAGTACRPPSWSRSSCPRRLS